MPLMPAAPGAAQAPQPPFYVEYVCWRTGRWTEDKNAETDRLANAQQSAAQLAANSGRPARVIDATGRTVFQVG